MHKLLLITSILLICKISHANFHIPGLPSQTLNTLATTDKTLAKTGLSINEDDITSDQDLHKLRLNEAQLHEALVWGLNMDEE